MFLATALKAAAIVSGSVSMNVGPTNFGVMPTFTERNITEATQQLREGEMH